MNFLPFEFYPHFRGSDEEITKIMKYSDASPNVIFACNDCDGIIFNNDRIECIGKVSKVYKGKLRDS